MNKTITLTNDQIQAFVNAAQRAQADAWKALDYAESALLRAQEAKRSADEQMALVTRIVTGA
jgi:hypothetical protein